MSSAEFDIEHAGEMYWVEVEYSRTWVDDSFNCHIGGRDGVHECGHWEVDPEDWAIRSCTDGEGDEVDVGLVPGLEDLIAETVCGLDVDE